MMNPSEKSYDDMTLEELQQELRAAFLDTDIIDEPLSDELERMREALNRKRPVEYLYTPEESWERFLEKCTDEEAFIRGGSIAAQKEADARPKRYRAVLRSGLIAAAVIALLVGAVLAADSLGLWAWAPKWNDAAGRFEPAAMEASGESPIPAALRELGITESVYPARLPKGFVITESRISEDPLVLMEQYARGDKRLSIIITPIKGFETVVYQKGGKPAQEYVSGKVVHYAFETENTITVVWYTKHYATTISGNMTREEIKGILDSIHEGAA